MNCHHCRHRFNTNRTICAVPCDGIDDMCLDYVDEDNCKIPGFATLAGHVASAAVIFGAAASAIAVLRSAIR